MSVERKHPESCPLQARAGYGLLKKQTPAGRGWSLVVLLKEAHLHSNDAIQAWFGIPILNKSFLAVALVNECHCNAICMYVTCHHATPHS